MEKRIAAPIPSCLLPRFTRILRYGGAIEERIAPPYLRCLLPRFARILKPGAYGSL